MFDTPWSEITDSELHLIAFYTGLRIEAAVQCLRELKNDEWPAGWTESFNLEFVSLKVCP
jgi:hypothetical protein